MDEQTATTNSHPSSNGASPVTPVAAALHTRHDRPHVYLPGAVSPRLGRARGIRVDDNSRGGLPQLTVATDGSVKGEHTGFAWLAESGRYGLAGRRDRRWMIGPEAVLVAELRAIDAAVRSNPGYRLTVVTDSQRAADMVRGWAGGRTELPAGYTTQRLSGRTAGLVSAQHRMVREAHRLDVVWASGHCGEPLNEGADALARLARRYCEGHSGLTRYQYTKRADGLADAFATAVTMGG